MSDPLSIWLEKKQFLEVELAKTSDASQKFTLQKQIQECNQEIARLQNQTKQNNSAIEKYSYFIEEIKSKYKSLSTLTLAKDINLLIKQFDFFGVEWSNFFGFTVAIIKADSLKKEEIESLFKTFKQVNDYLYKTPNALELSYLVWLATFTLSGVVCFVFEKDISPVIREFIQSQQQAAAAYEKGFSSFFWVQSSSTSLSLAINLDSNSITHSIAKNKQPDNSNLHAINTIKHLNKLEGSIQQICQSFYSQLNFGDTSKKSNLNTNESLISILEKRKQQLMEDIASAYKQLGYSMSEVDKVRIQRHIKDLEGELTDVESKIYRRN